MKANEFIKKFGWDVSKLCIGNCMSPNDKWFIHEGELICDKDFDDLKRLVESYELVESYGGLIQAKIELPMVDLDYDYNSPLQVILKQAIADVESCQ